MDNKEKKLKAIPYGIMNFQNFREKNYYFIDKTQFIPKLEQAGEFLFFIRPRRMGKSLWVSLLECYYDILYQDQFENLFYDTWILENPTQDQYSFLILRLNFSAVNPDLEKVEKSFDTIGSNVLEGFCMKYKDYLGEDFLRKVKELNNFADQISLLFFHVVSLGLKLYLFIDEYDNFSNTILSVSGSNEYHKLTHGDGFFRYFFNVIKEGAMRTGAGHIKLFITGVSPITMDDVTSGFNIASNISLDRPFNDMIGFTEQEVSGILQYYSDQKALPLSVEESLDLMKKWYDGYQFSESASENLFNSDMVLYFIRKAMLEQRIPKQLIDHNVRIDYGKLRHLITIDKKLNGNFSRLKSIMEIGEAKVRIAESFPLEELTNPDYFHSLLYYFGLLTYGENRRGADYLRIPNQTIYELMFGYIRDALRDTNQFRLDLWKLSNLIYDMAFDGEWKSVFQFIAQEIERQTSIRDYLDGEKTIQGFLSAYLNATDYYICTSEAEMNKGYSDFFLEPFIAKYPDIQYGCLVEVKYIARSQFSQKELDEKIEEAKVQIASYEQDSKLQEKMQRGKLLKLILVFKGWELIHQERL